MRGIVLASFLLMSILAHAQDRVAVKADAIVAHFTRTAPAAPQIAGDGFTTLETSNVLSLTKVVFAVGSAKLGAPSHESLDQVAAALQSLQKSAPDAFKVAVEGHTCDRGKPQTNETLSARRAEAVRDYLVSKGLADSLFETRGWGSARPVRPNAGEDERAQNRRVDIILRWRKDALPPIAPPAQDEPAQALFRLQATTCASSKTATNPVGARITDLREGDGVRFEIQMFRSAYVYALHLGPQGAVTWLAPKEHTSQGLWWYWGAQYSLPNGGKDRYFELVPPAGAEIFVFIATAAPLAKPEILPTLLKARKTDFGLADLRATQRLDTAEVRVVAVEHPD